MLKRGIPAHMGKRKGLPTGGQPFWFFVKNHREFPAAALSHARLGMTIICIIMDIGLALEKGEQVFIVG
jgi:hypothetical protein